MKRIFASVASIVLLLSLLLSCTGCHGAVKRAEFTLPESFDENRQYELTFWAKNDTNVTQTRIYEKAIADFEALYPNVKITLRLYTCIKNQQSDSCTCVRVRYMQT